MNFNDFIDIFEKLNLKITNFLYNLFYKFKFKLNILNYINIFELKKHTKTH